MKTRTKPKPSPHEIQIIAIKWQRVVDGERLVWSNTDLDVLEALIPETGSHAEHYKRFVTIPNPDRLGILDPYIGYIKQP